MTSQEINLKRRSVNYFDKAKGIDFILLKRIISEAVYAPSAYNLQPWRIILVKTEKAKEKLYNAAFKQQKILDAPATMIIVGDKEGFNEDRRSWNVLKENIGEEKALKVIDGAKKLYGGSEESKVKFAASNAALLAMNIMILAKAYGYDTHPISGMNTNKISEEFNIEKHESVEMLISIGSFDENKKLSRRKKRFLYEDIVKEF